MKLVKPKPYNLPSPKYYFDIPIINIKVGFIWVLLNIWGYFKHRDILCLIDVWGKQYLTLGERKYHCWECYVYWLSSVGGKICIDDVEGFISGEVFYIERAILIRSYTSWIPKLKKRKKDVELRIKFIYHRWEIFWMSYWVFYIIYVILRLTNVINFK
jgi:hypothetical protein